MKINMSIDIEPERVAKVGWFSNGANIYLRFTYCTYEEFYEWLEKNSKRMQSICEKWGWVYDVGYGDKGIKFSK